MTQYRALQMLQDLKTTVFNVTRNNYWFFTRKKDNSKFKNKLRVLFTRKNQLLTVILKYSVFESNGI